MRKLIITKVKPKPRGTLFVKVCALAETAASFAQNLDEFKNHFNYDLPQIKSGNNGSTDLKYRLVVAEDNKSAVIQYQGAITEWRDVMHIKPISYEQNTDHRSGTAGTGTEGAL